MVDILGDAVDYLGLKVFHLLGDPFPFLHFFIQDFGELLSVVFDVLENRAQIAANLLMEIKDVLILAESTLGSMFVRVYFDAGGAEREKAVRIFTEIDDGLPRVVSAFRCLHDRNRNNFNGLV